MNLAQDNQLKIALEGSQRPPSKLQGKFALILAIKSQMKKAALKLVND